MLTPHTAKFGGLSATAGLFPSVPDSSAREDDVGFLRARSLWDFDGAIQTFYRAVHLHHLFQIRRELSTRRGRRRAAHVFMPHPLQEVAIRLAE